MREVFQRLGDIYFDSTKYAEAIAVYKTLLSKWPDYTDAPRVQDKIVRSYERDRNLIAAAKEREALGRNYTKGSAWYEKNKDNPEALAVAQQLAEDALLTAATNVHAGAQACKTKWQENQKDLKKLEECKALYRTAAELYEKYLAAYPNSKRSYEFSAFYADALYYSGQLPQAIVAYQTVRDSQLDNRYQEDSAFRMIKAYEEIIDDMRREKKIDDPPIPDEKNTKPPVTAIPMPDIYLKYTAAIDWYVDYIKNERTPDLKYAAAVIALRYHNWPEARRRLGEITQLYCGPNSGDRLQGVRRHPSDLLHRLQRPGRGAEGLRARQAAQRRRPVQRIAVRQVAQGGAVPGAHRADQGVGEDDDHHQAPAAVDGERGEGDQQGAHGLPRELRRHRDGHRRQHRRRRGGKPGEKPSKISTELDVGLALDLIDVVNANPKDSGAPTALNNACVIYEKLFQFGEATKCYERLYKDYPESEWGKEALWNSSRNHYRFFEFDQAVKGYLTVAQDPKFASVGAPQGGAGPGGVAARQRPAVSEGGGSLQALLRGGVRQAAGQRAGLLLRLQRLRKGQGHRPSRRPASRTSSRSSTTRPRPAT